MALDSINPIIKGCPNYDEYLNLYITTADRRYLHDSRVCREKVTLNYLPGIEIYTKGKFLASKEALRDVQLKSRNKKFGNFSVNINTIDPVLMALANRELPNLQKNISTIIYMLDSSKSGLIDYEDSLQRARNKVEGAIDWANVFHEKEKLKPGPNDLSFCDFRTGHIQYRDSLNFCIVHDPQDGVAFLHRRDHKKIRICQDLDKKDLNFTRSVHYSNLYGFVIFFDLILRKKT